MRKLLLSMLATFLVIGLVGAGTFAWFQDQETSTGNIFQAGTLDLKIRDFADGQNWTDGVTKTWQMSNMTPGVTTVFGAVELKKEGSIAADHLEITCSYTVNDDPDVESDTDKETWKFPERFAKYMQITEMIYSNGAWRFNCLTGQKYIRVDGVWVPDGAPQAKWRIDDLDGVGGVSLYDLNQVPLDDLTPPDGSNTQLDLTLKFHQNAGNDLQGDTLNLTMIFTLNQDSSQ